MLRTRLCLSLWALVMSQIWPASARAIFVSATGQTDTLQSALVQAGTGITVQNLNLTSAGFGSTGTYSNSSNTYGIQSGIVISTGHVLDYHDSIQQTTEGSYYYVVAATSAQNGLLAPITGTSSNWDATQIDISFDMQSGYDGIRFLLVFGTEEYPDFVGGQFSDAFGAYLNGSNIALVSSQPINSNNSSMANVPGTILNGVLTNPSGTPGPYIHEISASVANGSSGNVLRIVLGDALDGSLDSTVFIAQLSGIPASPPLVPGDYNQDGVVDAADYVAWRKTDGTPAGYNAWRTHFGQSSGSGSVAYANAAVPEPTTLVNLIVAAVGIRLRRRDIE